MNTLHFRYRWKTISELLINKAELQDKNCSQFRENVAENTDTHTHTNSNMWGTNT